MSTPILLKNSEKANISDRGFRSPKRAAFEFYPTPPEAVRALLSMESFEGSVWEGVVEEPHQFIEQEKNARENPERTA